MPCPAAPRERRQRPPHRIDGVLQLCQPVRHGRAAAAAAGPEARAHGARAPPAGREELVDSGEDPFPARVGRPRNGRTREALESPPLRMFKEKLDLALSAVVCLTRRCSVTG